MTLRSSLFQNSVASAMPDPLKVPLVVKYVLPRAPPMQYSGLAAQEGSTRPGPDLEVGELHIGGIRLPGRTYDEESFLFLLDKPRPRPRPSATAKVNIKMMIPKT